jgi:transposase-like protein
VLRLVRRRYGGEVGERFGPTLAAEHLQSDEGLKVDHETLRRWMLAEGLWSRERKRKQHRRRRERQEHFGELVQMDGSFEAWLPGSGQKQCLMNMVDDATSKTLSQLQEQETTWAAVDVLRAWIEKYGVPHALYTDWKNVYLREPTAKERLRGEAPLTQFGQMCRKLGVRIIGASSPQAKGRVERSNGTQQDRLIKKLRLYRMRTMEKANRYLRQHYLPDHNRRFSREPHSTEDYHRQRPSRAELDALFRLEQERVISNDWVVQYQGRLLQIERKSRYAPAGGKVVVSEGRDGGLQICYRDRAVRWREIAAPPPRAESRPRAPGHALQLRRNEPQPVTHPWKQWRPNWLPGQAVAAVRSGP